MVDSEVKIKKQLESQGYNVFKAGFPDFIVQHNNGNIAFVEVKTGFDVVRPNQKEVHSVLRKAGFNVEVWEYPCNNRKLNIHNINLEERQKELLHKWVLEIESSVRSATEILFILRHIFIEKEYNVKKQLGGYSMKKLFDWKRLHASISRFISNDARHTTDQIKMLCEVGEDNG